MAAFTSKASGNWNSAGQTTWNETGTPGAGDTVSIGAHLITVTANAIAGTSTAADEIAIADGGELQVAAGITFEFRGHITLAGTAVLRLKAGAILEAGGNAALRIKIGAANNQTARMVCEGTSGSYCVVRPKAGDTGSIKIQDGGFTNGGMLQCEYTDFTVAGAAPAFAIWGWLSSYDFFLRHCRFINGGRIGGTSNFNSAAKFEISNCTWSGSSQVNNVNIAFNAPSGGAARIFTGNVCDLPLKLITMTGFIIEDNLLFEASDLGGAGPASFARNLVVKNSQPVTNLAGDIIDCVFWKNADSNPHFMSWIATQVGTLRAQGNIFEQISDSPGSSGDCILVHSPSSAATLEILNNIFLRNSAGGASGTLFSALGNANITLKVRHNTSFSNGDGNGSAAMAETYLSHAGMLAEMLDNLIYSTSSAGQVLCDSGTNDAAANAVTAAHHNSIWNSNADAAVSAPYENSGGAWFAATPGTGDVYENPGFVDPAVSIRSWDAANGGPGTRANAIAEMKKKNDPSGFNAAYTLANYRSFVRAGFTPTNTNLQGAASDSGDIGAVAVQSVPSRRARVAGVELSVPVAERAARVAGVELGVPEYSRKLRIAAAVLETPNDAGNRHARVSGVEVSFPPVSGKARVSGVELTMPDRDARVRISCVELRIPELGGQPDSRRVRSHASMGIGIGV